MSNQDSPTTLTKPFMLGKISIDPENEKLSNGQSPISCEPKVFAILLYFCAHPDQIISRDQLLADLWQGRVVSDNAINRKIYQLRKLLQSLDNTNEYVETVPKRGYKLVQRPIEAEFDHKSTPNAHSQIPKQLEQANIVYRTLLNRWWLGPILLLVFVSIWNTQQTVIEKSPIPKLTPLTSLQGIERFPALSSNNQHLVYSHSKDGRSHQLKQIDLHNNVELELTEAKQGIHDINSQWHPTLKKLAFIRITNEGECFIYQITFDRLGQALKPQKIIQCISANQPTITWGAEEHQLFIAERARKTLPYQLYSIDTATGAKKQLTHDDNQSNTKGHYYIKRNASGDKLVSLKYLASNKVQVNTYNSHDFSTIDSFELTGHLDDIAWQHNEQAFYFKRNKYIEKVNAKGLNRETVFHVGQDFSHLSFSADGNKLLLSSKENITNIYHYDIQSQQTSHSVVRSTKQDKRPAMANTSLQMAFISNRSGTNQLWLTDKELNIKPLKPLPFDLAHNHVAWSPDDQQLLFEYQDQIYLFNIETGHHYPIINHEHQAYYASWSASGEHIIYGSNKTDNWQLWRYDINNQTHQQLTFNGGYAGQTDHNGQLYFSKYHHNGLYRQNPDGSETLLIEGFSLLNWLNWKLKGNTIYFAKLWGETPRKNAGIYSYQIATGEERLIMPIEPQQLHDYTIANDGSFIRYTRLEEQAGDILMLELN